MQSPTWQLPVSAGRWHRFLNDRKGYSSFRPPVHFILAFYQGHDAKKRLTVQQILVLVQSCWFLSQLPYYIQQYVFHLCAIEVPGNP